MKPAVDHLGLIADQALQQLVIRAREIERQLFLLPPSAEHAAIVASVEAMRDEADAGRARIKALAMKELGR